MTMAAGDELSFWHTHTLESACDGGVVEVSTDGGRTWADIGEAAFTERLQRNAQQRGSNPIGGPPCLQRRSPYVKSVARLAAYVGQNILMRFRVASDASVAGSDGPSTTWRSATRSPPPTT